MARHEITVWRGEAALEQQDSSSSSSSLQAVLESLSLLPVSAVGQYNPSLPPPAPTPGTTTTPAPSPFPTQVLMLGLPPQLSEAAFLALVEPYLGEFVKHELVLGSRVDDGGATTSFTSAQHALLTFRTQRAAQSFVEVFNNMHFPDFPFASPSLVLLVDVVSASARHPDALPLPTCPVCLRRISAHVTQIPGRCVSSRLVSPVCPCCLCNPPHSPPLPPAPPPPPPPLP